MGFFDAAGKETTDQTITDYLRDGALVMDVRSPEEFEQGQVADSRNIPLHTLPARVDEVKSYGKKIIAVCRSGARSGQATEFLGQQGVDIINGGPWEHVAKFL